MERQCFNWDLLIKLVDKYYADAEKCPECEACFAALVSEQLLRTL
jgi:hypothetical protein